MNFLYYLTFGQPYFQHPFKSLYEMELHIGSNIRKIRKLKGFCQKYLAAELGINVSAYSKLEHKDNLSIYYITRIADIMDVSYACIIEFDEEKFLMSYISDFNE